MRGEYALEDLSGGLAHGEVCFALLNGGPALGFQRAVDEGFHALPEAGRPFDGRRRVVPVEDGDATNTLTVPLGRTQRVDIAVGGPDDAGVRAAGAIDETGEEGACVVDVGVGPPFRG